MSRSRGQPAGSSGRILCRRLCPFNGLLPFESKTGTSKHGELEEAGREIPGGDVLHSDGLGRTGAVCRAGLL